MNKHMRKFLSMILAVTLTFVTLGLAGCGGGETDEQDNCYGEDMPVVNED